MEIARELPQLIASHRLRSRVHQVNVRPLLVLACPQPRSGIAESANATEKQSKPPDCLCWRDPLVRAAPVCVCAAPALTGAAVGKGGVYGKHTEEPLVITRCRDKAFGTETAPDTAAGLSQPAKASRSAVAGETL